MKLLSGLGEIILHTWYNISESYFCAVNHNMVCVECYHTI